MIHHSLSPGHISSWAQFKCALVRKSRLLLTFWWSSMIHSSEGLERMTSLTAAQAIPWHVSWCWAWLWRCIFSAATLFKPRTNRIQQFRPWAQLPSGASSWCTQAEMSSTAVSYSFECFHPWMRPRPNCCTSGLLDDGWLAWWCGWHDDVVDTIIMGLLTRTVLRNSEIS